MTQTEQAAKNQQTKDNFDPICGMEVRSADAPSTTYDERTFRFCSESCKQRFLHEPARYIVSYVETE